MKRVLVAFLALCLMVSVACASAEQAGKADYKIPVVGMGYNDQFWQTVYDGVNAAAKDENVEVFCTGPASKGDVDSQVNMLKTAIASGSPVIILAVLSTESVTSELKECINKGIKVIGFDSGVPNAPEGSVAATVATDNEKAAALGADKMFENQDFQAALKEAAPEKPMVIGVIVRDAILPSVVARATGFVNQMKKLCEDAGKTVSVDGHPVWEKVQQNPAVIIRVQVPAESTATGITNLCSSVLNIDNLKAVFLTNEDVVNGFLSATGDGADMKEGGAHQGLLVAGFDSGSPQKNAVRNHWFIGSVSQKPFEIGYQAVKQALKVIHGEKPENIDTGAVWYTADNMDSDEVKKMLYD